MNKNILVYIEEQNNKIADVSLEILNKAQRLKKEMKSDCEISAVMIGSKLQKFTAELAKNGAEQIYLIESVKLKNYHPVYYLEIFKKICAKISPKILLFGATYCGTNLASLAAVEFESGLAAHSIELKLDNDDNLKAVVPAYGGKVLGDILFREKSLQIATIRSGALDKVEINIEVKDPKINLFNAEEVINFKSNLELLDSSTVEPKGVPLEKADIILCGGRGIKKENHWNMLNKMAEKLAGAAACTRPIVDKEWAAENIMIGTSGKNVKTKIYIGFGISGAAHHVCGMKDSDFIISVNIDEDAEIFNVSDIGIIADLEDIIPKLNKFIIEDEALI